MGLVARLCVLLLAFICSTLICCLLDTFDVHLTRSLTSLHILDFNPYLPHTDSLLFTYEELLSLLRARLSQSAANSGLSLAKPELRVITSRSHPAAARNAPANQHNMVPLDALRIASERDIEQFAETWSEEVRHGAASDSDEE